MFDLHARGADVVLAPRGGLGHTGAKCLVFCGALNLGVHGCRTCSEVLVAG